MPGTRRRPPIRPFGPRITRAALDIFVELRKRKYPTPQWWELHNQLHDELGLKPWEWPAVENPGSACVYPKGSQAAKDWQPNERGRELWQQLEAALEDVE
jgi:hypothetical protein